MKQQQLLSMDAALFCLVYAENYTSNISLDYQLILELISTLYRMSQVLLWRQGYAPCLSLPIDESLGVCPVPGFASFLNMHGWTHGVWSTVRHLKSALAT